jgi:lipoprotein-anchoring transpeptidase ErfK/SrfK
MRPPFPLVPRPRAAALGALGVVVAVVVAAPARGQSPAPADTGRAPAAAPRPDTGAARPAPARADTTHPVTPRPDSAAPGAAPGAAARPDTAPPDSARRDSVGSAAPVAAAPSDSIRGDTARPEPPRPRVFNRAAVLAEPAFPVNARSGTAALLHVQVLLDAAGFSPGMLDGRWGENVRVALFAFRESLGMDPDVEAVDAAAYAELRRRAGARPTVTTYVLDAADLRGPFRPVPREVAEKARVACLCYESLLERLSERFHATPALLRALNPGVDVAAARAGDALTVPNTWRLTPRGRVARVVVDKAAGGVRGLAADGRVLFWLPATVGSAAMPSPHGALRVESVTVGPHYRWDPAVLRDVSRRAPVRVLPPGPNNLVGSVWVALSRPHVGIHGTPDPERVGYSASHGCVRLTNWDALWFSRLARPGLPVIFE